MLLPDMLVMFAVKFGNRLASFTRLEAFFQISPELWRLIRKRSGRSSPAKTQAA